MADILAYITIAEAETYFSNYRLVTDAWDDSTAAKQQIALNQGKVMIDKLNYAGNKYDESQSDQFPRGADSTVPTAIKEANAEIAYALLDGIDVDYEYENLREASIGFASVRDSLNTGMLPQHIVNGIPSMAAWDKLIPYLRDVRAINLMRIS